MALNNILESVTQQMQPKNAFVLQRRELTESEQHCVEYVQTLANEASAHLDSEVVKAARKAAIEQGFQEIAHMLPQIKAAERAIAVKQAEIHLLRAHMNNWKTQYTAAVLSRGLPMPEEFAETAQSMKRGADEMEETTDERASTPVLLHPDERATSSHAPKSKRGKFIED